MALSVLLWTRTVVTFTGNKGWAGKFLVGCGLTIFVFQLVILVVNLFSPVAFTFDANKEYVALPMRYSALFMQMILFFGVAVFILCGFEHCVANMYYFSVAGMWSWKTLGWVLMMTLGNSVGGVFFPLLRRILAEKKAKNG